MSAISRMLWAMSLTLFLIVPFARAQDGVEPQARGPIHEGYANPVEGQPAAPPVVAKEPPAPIEEVPADQKPQGDNVQWIPGYWAWDDARGDFLWVSGFWRTPPPGRQWMAGSWSQVATGWQWTPGFWTGVETTEVSYLPPPPAPVEVGPSVPAPSADYIYVPGSWVYADGRYFWRPGSWVMARPGWVWVPSHYRWTPAGYIFIAGYWDYPLADRGLLFAPVWIDRRYVYGPRWRYTPTIAIYDDSLYGALFVRGGGYYFGDYFDVRYTSMGYHSWFSVSFGRSYAYDPLFSYYSYTYRHDPYWAPAMREVYVARYNGDMPRPPVQVGVAISFNFTNNASRYTYINRSTTIVNVTNVHTSVVDVRTVSRDRNAPAKFAKLETVSAARKTEYIEHSREVRAAAEKRGANEKQFVATNGQIRANDKPRTLKVDAPKTQISGFKQVSGPPPAVVHTNQSGNKPNTNAGQQSQVGNHQTGGNPQGPGAQLNGNKPIIPIGPQHDPKNDKKPDPKNDKDKDKDKKNGH